MEISKANDCSGWITEQDDWIDGGTSLLGTFDVWHHDSRDNPIGELSGGGFDEALAWLHARGVPARRITVRWDDGGRSATASEFDDQPELRRELATLQRRRRPPERWRDRTTADEPITWQITLLLFPPGLAVAYEHHSQQWVTEAEALADHLGARLDTAGIEAHQEDVRQSQDGFVYTSNVPAYVLHLEQRTATAAQAEAEVRRRLDARGLPEAWSSQVIGRPAETPDEQ